jgi:hypothetical protein
MFSQEDETLIWKYIDQDCTPEEEVLFQEKLKKNIGFQEQYKTILRLHNQLNLQEHEMPSFRFSKNVMEALPKRRPGKILFVKPASLVSRGYLVTVFSILFAVVTYLFLIDYRPAGSTAGIYVELTETTQQPFYLQMSWIIIGCFALLILDRYLHSRKIRYQSATPV